MLLGQNRGGNQHGYLFPVHNSLENRAHGHLGLAITHVSTNQAIHGTSAFHIPFDIIDALQLIRSFFIRKSLLKFLLPGGIQRESITFTGLPAGIKAQQVFGHFPDRLGNLFPGALPFTAAQFAQAGSLFFRSGILIKQIQLFYRQIQLIGSGILQENIFPGDPVIFHLGHTPEDTYAVILMNNVIPQFQILQQYAFRGFFTLMAAGPMSFTPYILFSDHGSLQSLTDKAFFHGPIKKAGRIYMLIKQFFPDLLPGYFAFDRQLYQVTLFLPFLEPAVEHAEIGIEGLHLLLGDMLHHRYRHLGNITGKKGMVQTRPGLYSIPQVFQFHYGRFPDYSAFPPRFAYKLPVALQLFII